MPSAPRSSKQFKLIAFSLFGKPPAIEAKRNKKLKKYEQLLRTRTVPNAF